MAIRRYYASPEEDDLLLAWLRNQTHRQDSTGELARFAMTDRDWPRNEPIHKVGRYLETQCGAWGLNALELIYAEWKIVRQPVQRVRRVRRDARERWMRELAALKQNWTREPGRHKDSPKGAA
jgi:hypothetical protein